MLLEPSQRTGPGLPVGSEAVEFAPWRSLSLSQDGMSPEVGPGERGEGIVDDHEVAQGCDVPLIRYLAHRFAVDRCL